MENKKFDLETLAKKSADCALCSGMLGDDWRNHRCAECRFMEMNNDAYNDGTRRCAWLGEWKRPSSPACYKFSW